jgi:hypothetical protein
MGVFFQPKEDNNMANELSPYKRKISIALKIETIAKIDKRAEMDGTSRNAVAEYILSAALERLQLNAQELQAVEDEVKSNIEKRKEKRG